MADATIRYICGASAVCLKIAVKAMNVLRNLELKVLLFQSQFCSSQILFKDIVLITIAQKIYHSSGIYALILKKCKFL